MIDWYVEGDSFGSCNCDYSCPCQFEALPTQGHCRGFEAMEIETGHFGDVDLSGVRYAVFYAWPGPVFEGGGECQIVIDERADKAQRDALERVLMGEETEEAATHWWVFQAMSDTKHPTVYAPIDVDTDMESRTARVAIPGIVECTATPIHSPVTGDEHRVRIQIPEGIEFEVAEVGSGTTNATGAVKLELENTYAQFSRSRHRGTGIVRD